MLSMNHFRLNKHPKGWSTLLVLDIWSPMETKPPANEFRQKTLSLEMSPVSSLHSPQLCDLNCEHNICIYLL